MDDDQDSVLEISSKKHYQTHQAAEIMVRMDPRMRGIFFSSDYDLLLVLDSEHFTRNREILDKLRPGSDIKFRGFLRSMGPSAEPVFNEKNRKKPTAEEEDEILMPFFTVFDL